jgi:hypothetical protein
MLLFGANMENPQKSKNAAAVELGRRGGKARAKALSAGRRKAIATKAAKAAAKVRKKKVQRSK